MSEADLAKHVVGWLESQHWDVYQEVRFSTSGAVADIAAVRDGKLWIIECKTSLTFTVLEQASRWPCHFRSAAVPKPKTRDRHSRDFAYRIAFDYLRIGIVEVNPDFATHGVSEWKHAPIMREYHRSAKFLISRLKEEQKHYCEAGSASGGYYTPYRATIDKVQLFIIRNPGCTLKEIMAYLGDEHHYSSNATARSSIRTALNNWEKDWCKVDKSENTWRYHCKRVEKVIALGGRP